MGMESTGRPLKKPMAFLGKGLGLSIDVVELSAASLLSRLMSEGQSRCLAQLPVGISWLVRKTAGSLRGLERAIRDLEELEAHVRLANFFRRLDKLETRGPFVGGTAGDRALGSLAAVHKEVLIALEHANTNFEKGNLRVKTFDGAAGVLP